MTRGNSKIKAENIQGAMLPWIKLIFAKYKIAFKSKETWNI